MSTRSSATNGASRTDGRGLLASHQFIQQDFYTRLGAFVMKRLGFNTQIKGEIINLINKARADAGVPTLTLNAQLAASAQAHSTDMACNGYFDHKGRNNSTIHDRVVAAGYAPKFSEEMIFCSGYPADAFKWWMGDPPHHDVIVDPRVKEIGVGYAYLPHSSCGSYYAVDLGMP